jgi:small subunit ribosomal protein S8
MAMTDPVADMITRIRNGQNARLFTVTSPHSQLREDVAKVLQGEGYINNYDVVDGEDGFKQLKVELRYVDGKGVIKTIKRVSKPGRRVYSKIKELQSFYNGLGIYILSTPQGVMSDHDARKTNVGGEVLCSVF